MIETQPHLQAEVARVGPYHVVDRLGEGGMGVVYRAIHVRGGPEVALKTVRVSGHIDYARLRMEIHALSRLREPGIVRILEHGIDAGVPWYAMELLEGVTVRAWNRELWGETPLTPASNRARFDAGLVTATTFIQGSSAPLPPGGASPLSSAALPHTTGRPVVANGRLGEAIDFYRRLCDPLAALHGHGLIHRDLKPDNVFVRPTGEPVIMDLGAVSMHRGPDGREVLDVMALVLGTLFYMAPEQTRGELVDARADLYAFGCMLYETLSGQRPFEGTDAQEVLNRQRSWNPPRLSEIVDDVPPPLDVLLQNLMAKRPGARIGHADDVAEVLTSLGPVPSRARTRARQPGHLYRPEIVGRTALLDSLTTHLEPPDGKLPGTFVLLGGESGVGKTSVATELGRRAFRRRFRVVVGQCLPMQIGDASDGDFRGPPLHPFRDLLRAIADLCLGDPSGATFERLLGPRANILARFEPILASLPHAAAYPGVAPELPAEESLRRVVNTMVDALAAFAAESPLCLILDDLQWADDVSLRVLSQVTSALAERIPPMSLFILGTHRAEEMTSALRFLAKQPGVSCYELERLDEASVGALVGGMLGMTDPPGRLLRTLFAQSEGNPFFVAEYLRAAQVEGILVREAGQWTFGGDDATASTRLDAVPVPGSIGDLAHRRLRGLSVEALQVARAAAVRGREMDGDFLEQAVDLRELVWLDARKELLGRHILEEAADGRLRFMHDKLREAVYREIGAEELALLHERIGSQLEHRYERTADWPIHFTELAHHYSRSGNAMKAVYYLERSGEQALANFSNREAISHLRGALELGRDREVTVEPARLARWQHQLGEAFMGLGDAEQSEAHLRHALKLQGEAFPATKPGLLFGLIGQLCIQAGHRLWRRTTKVAPDGESAASALLDAAKSYERLSQVYFQEVRMLPTLYATVRSLNLSERAGPSPLLACAYATALATAGLMTMHGLAGVYRRRALKTLDEVRDSRAEAWSLMVTMFYHLGIAAWDEAEAAGRRALDAATTIGHRKGWEEAMMGLSFIRLLRGALDESASLYSALRDSGARGNPQLELWGWTGLSWTNNRLGRSEGALQALTRAQALMTEYASPVHLAINAATRAFAELRRGDLRAARQAADEAAPFLHSAQPIHSGLVVSQTFLGDVYLALWAETAETLREPALRRAVSRSIRALRRFAWVFPIARPAAAYCAGQAQLLRGRQRTARKLLTKSLKAAQECGMVFDEARAEVGLGTLVANDVGQRTSHLERALALFQRTGSTVEADRVCTLLAGESSRNQPAARE